MTLELRPASADEIPALYQLHRRIEIADQIQIVTPIEEFEEWVDDPHFSFPEDSRVAVKDSQIVGFARTWYRPSDGTQSRVFLIGGVDPDFRRQGIGSALFGWEMDRGRQILATASPEHPRYMRTMAYDFEDGAIALYEAHGFEPIRYSYELIRPLTGVEEVPASEGIEIVAWDQQRTEELRQVTNAAFADHWGSTPVDRESWDHRINSFGARFDLSFMAVDSDRIVGVLFANHFPDDEKVTGRLDGWVISLGTLATYRKRGIASSLMLTACNAFYNEGFTHAALGVDSESPTGAYRLYQKLGFVELNKSVQHQVEL